jgi:predicted RNase H-like HicB family nuclease
VCFIDVARVRSVVIYEPGPTSWGTWVPDLPGCVAAGETRAEVEQPIGEAIDAHIVSLREHGEVVNGGVEAVRHECDRAVDFARRDWKGGTAVAGPRRPVRRS